MENPYDPWKRTDLSERERIVLEFTDGVLHGDRMELIDRYVAPDYVQHTPGIGQGPEGLRRYVERVAKRRQGRSDWRPIQIFAAGDFVILHKLLPAVVIADFFRFDADNRLAEHWDVVQPLPEPGYDPLRVSSENFTRFYQMYDLTPV
jgi:predicted SnoaL-like aldol condensation-catalyzing enzyme